MTPRRVTVGPLVISNNLPFTLIAGPCQMESRAHALEIASLLKEIAQKLSVPLVYKTSFDKANRTSLGGVRGLGLKEALPVFAEIRETLKLPVLTDIHEIDHCRPVSEVVDIMQIPAFLCRQTDLILMAGKTNAAINVKKVQFLAPWDIKNVVSKLESTGNKRILVTERGVSFGYNTLVTDMRKLPIMAKTSYPVVIDATHAVQQPGGEGSSSGGQREFAPVIARAGVAVGVAAVFLETHPDPDSAPSDGPNMIHLKDMPEILATLKSLDSVAKANPVQLAYS